MTPEGKERQRAAVTKHGQAGDGKGKNTSRKPSLTYLVWKAIRTRCLNPKSKDYARYGGAGVTLCEAWKEDFNSFLQDMGERPSRAHTIDRRDNSKGYEPGNCRWATIIEQNNNRTNNVHITFEGVTRTASQMAQAFGIAPTVFIKRIRRGWPLEEALRTPERGKSRRNCRKRV